MDVYGKSGNYFRANLWSWRPINALIDHVNDLYDLGIDTSGFPYNDGAGVDNQEKCNELADKIEGLINNDNFKDHDIIYVNMGAWSNENGKTYYTGDIESLDEDYPIGSVLFNSVVIETGEMLIPTHATDKEHVHEFISFLRECNGFKIY